MQLSPTPAAPSLTPKVAPIPEAAKLQVPDLPTPIGAPKAAKPGTASPSSIVNMSVADAVAAATGHLTKVQELTVGGGTKEGAAAAMTAAKLLQETSMVVQVAHRNAIGSHLSPELEVNLMSVASTMASASSQVALAGIASKQPMPLKELLAKPAKQATDVLAALADHVARTDQQAANPTITGGYL